MRERDLTSRKSIRREERKSFRITDVEENRDREQEEEKEKGGEWKGDTSQPMGTINCTLYIPQTRTRTQ